METWTERLRVSLDVFSQLNDVQASLFVNRKLGELGAAVHESMPEFTRFRLASLRIDVRDFHSTSPTLRFEIDDFLQLFDSLTAQCDPPLPQTHAMRLLCTIQFILLRGRRWVDEYNDDSMGVDPSVLFGKYSKHLSPYLGNPFDPTNAVQRDAKEFQRHMDEFLVYREGPLVHEKLVGLLGRYPLLPFQVKLIRFLNAVEDLLFPTNNPTVVAFASKTPPLRVSRRSLQRPIECTPETWLALDKCLADAVKDKHPRPNDQPPPPPQVAELAAHPTAPASSPAPSSQRLGKRRQRDITPLVDVKSEKAQDDDDVVALESPESIKDDKKWKHEEVGLTTPQRRRKRRVMWTDEEEDAVRQGVARFGESSWAEIKLHYPNVLLHRTSEQIKDKYRNIQKRLSKGSSA